MEYIEMTARDKKLNKRIIKMNRKEESKKNTIRFGIWNI